MNAEKFSQAMNEIDDKYIERTINYHPQKTNNIFTKWSSIAACLVLTLAVILTSFYHFNSPPKYDGAYLSAADIGGMFSTKDNGTTSSYTEVYCPQNRELKLNPLPINKYGTIYRIKKAPKDLSKEELSSFEDRIMPKLTEALGMPISSFEKKELDYSASPILSNNILTLYDNSKIQIEFNQTDGSGDYGIESCLNQIIIFPNDQPLVLNGKEIFIDKSQTEEEIIESLSWVRDILFNVFNVNFDRTKVDIGYNGYNKSGIQDISVCYYNETYTDDFRHSDYISLYFYEPDDTPNNPENTNIIKKCGITYNMHRTPVNEYLEAEAKCKLITLDEAEKMLSNGYVFGGHSCPICMSLQEKISFDKYDYVSYEYITDRYGELSRAVPFYVFYKKIGTAENGNNIYARTYVCAIELSGIEEYFKDQEKNHQSY